MDINLLQKFNLCACGCGKKTKREYYSQHKNKLHFCKCGCGLKTSKIYYRRHEPKFNLCACGCGLKTKKIYYNRHKPKLSRIAWNKGLTKKTKSDARLLIDKIIKNKTINCFKEYKPKNICDCGCGQLCNKKYIKGHNTKGKKHTPEQNKAKSKKMMGHKVKQETKNKIGKSKMGNKYVLGKHIHIGQVAWNKGLTKEIDERVKKYSEKQIGIKRSIETKKLQSEIKIGKKQNETTKNKRSLIFKELWKNPEYKEKMLQKMPSASGKHPNKLEKYFIEYFNKNFLYDFEYTGNGKILIGCKSPDFINEKTKQIIEIFGCYFHKCKECKLENSKMKETLSEIERIEHFSKFGYKTLIVWEHETKNKEILFKKLQNFCLNSATLMERTI